VQLCEVNRSVLFNLMRVENRTEMWIEFENLQRLVISELGLERVTDVEGVQQVVVEQRSVFVFLHVFDLCEVLKACDDRIFKHSLMLIKQLIEPFQQPQA